MKNLAWLALAYAVYLGVENWNKMRELEETVDQHHKWLLETYAAVGRHK